MTMYNNSDEECYIRVGYSMRCDSTLKNRDRRIKEKGPIGNEVE